MSALSQHSRYKWGLLSVFAIGIAVRAATSLQPYSGENSPPMYGDYEAQRHWMEITLHLPVVDWYRNTSQNDLSYWGLDYPPLSAYASYVFAKLLQYIDPDAVVLRTSRGYQTFKSRATMRATVLIVDILLFFPALVLLSIDLYTKHMSDKFLSTINAIFLVVAFVTTLPSLIVIDHAHFQYNNFSLALFLLSLKSFANGNQPVGAVFFCAAVYFKHMSLYYALAIFAYLLALTIRKLKQDGLLSAFNFAMRILLAIIAITVIVFFPWLKEKDLMLGLLRRFFPLTRGLYEDKVANLWCSISIFIKLNVLLSQQALFAFCATVTVIASLPFCVAVFQKPSTIRLFLSTSGCSLAAFLFSYQVHEKQILIPLLPLALLYPLYPTLSTWMSLTAAFSLFPLLLREKSTTAYVASIILHCSVIFLMNEDMGIATHRFQVRAIVILPVLLGCCLNLALIFVTPPAHAPDIFVLTNTMYSCANLCIIYLLLIYEVFVS